jgi:hypothetical protein
MRLHDLHAVHVVHVHVQQHEVGLLFPQEIHHLRAAGELGHTVGTGQHGLYGVVHNDVVVDDKYLLHPGTSPFSVIISVIYFHCY